MTNPANAIISTIDNDTLRQMGLTPTSATIDISLLRQMGSARFGKTVDWDMRGTPITDCCVLLHGAYGPAVMRLVNLAVQRETVPVDATRLAELAAEAFAQKTDFDFGGNVMTDYGIVLEGEYFGPVTLGLVNLAITERAVLAQVR